MTDFNLLRYFMSQTSLDLPDLSETKCRHHVCLSSIIWSQCINPTEWANLSSPNLGNWNLTTPHKPWAATSYTDQTLLVWWPLQEWQVLIHIVPILTHVHYEHCRDKASFLLSSFLQMSLYNINSTIVKYCIW